jgi:hypothetical protein
MSDQCLHRLSLHQDVLQAHQIVQGRLRQRGGAVAGAGIERNAAGHFGIRGREVAGECGLAVRRLCGACAAQSGIGSHKEYVRGDVHTNSAEGYFSIFRRGMRGIYQHCAEKHLHRYLAEYDFGYSNRIALGVNDGERAARAIVNASGKRLTYRQPHEA